MALSWDCPSTWSIAIHFPARVSRRAHFGRGEKGTMRMFCARQTRSLSKNYTPRAGTKKTSQAFAVFVPVKSVGVVGDGRRYAWVIALRAVETVDFMTARWGPPTLRLARARLGAHHQRDRRSLPSHLRHLQQAARDY